MKNIYLVAFRGMSISDPDYRDEHPLIRAGHVGIAFEGYSHSIYGFHPSDELIEAVGGIEAVFDMLQEGDVLAGIVQQDYDIFVTAYELAPTIPKEKQRYTTVYQYAVEREEADFEAIHAQITEWYNAGTIFPYAFPLKAQSPELGLPEHDNCATFPRRVGLPVLDPEQRGQMSAYMEMLQQSGELWKPEGS